MLNDLARLKRFAGRLEGVTVSVEYDTVDENIQLMVEQWFSRGRPSWEKLRSAIRETCERRDTGPSQLTSLVKQGINNYYGSSNVTVQISQQHGTIIWRHRYWYMYILVKQGNVICAFVHTLSLTAGG